MKDNEKWKQGFKEGLLEFARPEDLIGNKYVKELVKATRNLLNNEPYKSTISKNDFFSTVQALKPFEALDYE